jgi:hypothetical protein
MPTAVITVREMLADLIKYDGVLGGLLSDPKVVVGKAKPNTALPYVVLGATTETPEGAGYYNRSGHLGTETLHCWAKTKWTAQQIFARLSDLLDAQRPIVSGHVVMRGVLEYVTDGEDQDGKAWQVVARYRIRSLVGA